MLTNTQHTDILRNFIVYQDGHIDLDRVAAQEALQRREALKTYTFLGLKAIGAYTAHIAAVGVQAVGELFDEAARAGSN